MNYKAKQSLLVQYKRLGKLPMEISSDFLTALCVEAIHGLDGLQQIPTYHTNSHEIDRILTTPVLKFG